MRHCTLRDYNRTHSQTQGIIIKLCTKYKAIQTCTRFETCARTISDLPLYCSTVYLFCFFLFQFCSSLQFNLLFAHTVVRFIVCVYICRMHAIIIFVITATRCCFAAQCVMAQTPKTHQLRRMRLCNIPRTNKFQ